MSIIMIVVAQVRMVVLSQYRMKISERLNLLLRLFHLECIIQIYHINWVISFSEIAFYSNNFKEGI